MTKEWFIEKNGKWHGPFSSERLKALVAQNKLQANDKVRKGKDGKVVPAGKLKGLFGDPKHDAKSVPSPPPLSLEAAQSTSPPPLPTSVANETQHLASDLESPSANNDGDVLEQGNAVLTKLKSGASRFAANSKAAAQLLAIQANRQQIVRNLLPKSYQHLGEAIYGARTFADNLTDLYSELDKAQVNRWRSTPLRQSQSDRIKRPRCSSGKIALA